MTLLAKVTFPLLATRIDICGFWNTASFWYGVVDPEEFKNFWQEDKIECVREIWEPLTRA